MALEPAQEVACHCHPFYWTVILQFAQQLQHSSTMQTAHHLETAEKERERKQIKILAML
jgi:hypothetical protein